MQQPVGPVKPRIKHKHVNEQVFHKFKEIVIVRQVIAEIGSMWLNKINPSNGILFQNRKRRKKKIVVIFFFFSFFFFWDTHNRAGDDGHDAKLDLMKNMAHFPRFWIGQDKSRRQKDIGENIESCNQKKPQDEIVKIFHDEHCLVKILERKLE